MAAKATKDQKEQVKTLSYIDSLITILGDYPENLSLASSMDVNPFGFLISIAKSLGIFDEFLTFISKLIQYELPIIELGIKGILLANIKEIVSCSDDPFIPNYLRKKISNTEAKSGITFSISDLDYNNLLSIDPLSNGSEYSYLGIPRSYKAEYKIYQEYLSEIADIKSGPEYTNEQKCIDWITKKALKYSEKYTNTSEFNYDIYSSITSGTTEKYVPISKTLKEKKIVTTYTPSVYVEVVPVSSLNSCYVDEVKEFDTYADADSFLLQRKRKYSKQYKNKGCHTISSITPLLRISAYELARAKDFNAFLWFVCHMANFYNPIALKAGNTYSIDWNNKKSVQTWIDTLNNSISGLGLKYKEQDDISKSGPLGVITLEKLVKKGEENYQEINGLLGSTFVLQDGAVSSMYDLCIKKESTEKNSTFTIVPATSDINSLNWYGDRSKYFDFIKYWGSPKKEERQSPREYSNEIGICNIEFDSTINDTSQYSNFTRNQIRFTVLPKPLIHIPQLIGSTENLFRIKKILFNNLGKYDPKGKYSCFVTKDTKGQPIFHKTEDENYSGYYDLTTKNNTESIGLQLYIPKVWSEGLTIVQGKASGDTVPISCLYECYPNLTIYEFNYDYVMSQRLLDPKVLTGQIIESIMNVKLGMSGTLGANLNITHNITEGTLRQVVIDMITGDTEAYTINDCYNAFSNEKYNNLLSETENKKANGYHFEGTDRTVIINAKKINEILNEYDNPDITQEGQVDVINRAFQQAMVSITAATDDKESWDIKFNFIQQILQDLTFSVIEKLLTPKILMLIAVNKQLMGDDTEWTGNILNNLLQILIKIIKDIVKQITDIILQKILDFILEFLKPKISELMALITKEYTEQYRDQIAALISACGINWGTSSATAKTQIDNVTYADIDPTKEITEDNQC